jgi:hypothetical protein
MTFNIQSSLHLNLVWQYLAPVQVVFGPLSAHVVMCEQVVGSFTSILKPLSWSVVERTAVLVNSAAALVHKLRFLTCLKHL